MGRSRKSEEEVRSAKIKKRLGKEPKPDLSFLPEEAWVVILRALAWAGCGQSVGVLACMCRTIRSASVRMLETYTEELWVAAHQHGVAWVRDSLRGEAAEARFVYNPYNRLPHTVCCELRFAPRRLEHVLVTQCAVSHTKVERVLAEAPLTPRETKERMFTAVRAFVDGCFENAALV
jgi:hypothetical protein